MSKVRVDALKMPKFPKMPTPIPRASSNTKYQVSAGVRKRMSQMSEAEMDRVVAAGWAEAMMLLDPGLEETTARNPELAAKVRDDADKVKAIEGEVKRGPESDALFGR
jgi:hypothetical protein